MARVLFIDDDPFTLDTYATVIGYFGHEPLLAESAAAALRIVAENQPEIIFMDLNLPDMHGFDLLRRIKTNPATQAIPLVMVSASHESICERALEAGADHYLCKPVHPDQMLDMITQFCSP